MANPTISISGFSLLPERLHAGTPFTATITAKNNLGATALYAYLTAHIDMEGLDAGDSGAGRVILYSSGVQQISIANGASKALTLSGNISETARDELNTILEKYPSAPIRRNAIIWTLHMDNGGFEYSADTIYNAGELLDALYSPAIEAYRLERCIDGVPNDEGESLLSTIKLGLAEKARQALLSLKLYYSESAPAAADSDFIDLSSSIPDLIGGITDSAELIAQTFGNTANWNFLLVFGDEYESAVAAFSLSRAFANMHLSGATTGGVAFGGFSTAGEGDPKLESHYPFFAYAGINGVTNYSTEEVKTGGTWIDGKPIYRKVFSYNTFTASADFATDLLRSEIEAIISVDGFACVRNYPSTSQADYYFPVNMYNTDQTFIGAYVFSDKSTNSTLKLRVNKGSAYGTLTSLCVIIQYVKA